jgi:hypothetical protein
MARITSFLIYGAICTLTLVGCKKNGTFVAEDRFGGHHHSKWQFKKKNPYKSNVYKGGHPKPEFENKFTFCAYAGVLLPLGGLKTNPAGISENLYGNLKLGPVLGGGVFYNKTGKWSVGGRIHYNALFSPRYQLSALTTELDLKYYFVPSDKKVAPYVFAGANLSLVGIKQKSHDYYYYPERSYSVDNENSIPVTQIYYREPNTSVAFVPVPGFSFGLGTDIKLKSKLSFFVQAEGNIGFAKSNGTLQRYFPYNQTDFYSFMLTTGFTFKIVKNKDLY